MIDITQAAAAAENGTGPGAGSAPRFRSAREVMADRPPEAVIAGIAWRGRVTVLVAESGAGKTFLLLDLAAAVSDGRPWHDRRVRLGSVAYISFEGDAFTLRMQALHEAGATQAHVHLLEAREPLSPRVARDGTEEPSRDEQRLAASLATLAAELAAGGAPPLGLLVIDTVRASMTGSEDRSEDVAAYLRAVRRLLAPYPDAALILAHHAGWQDGELKRRRERGSSAFRGNVDATLYLEATGENPELGTEDLRLTALKVRDDLRPPPLRLIRSRVTLQAVDDEGRPLRTCRIQADHRTQEDREAEETRRRGATQAALDQRVYELIATHSITSMEMLRDLLGVSMPATRAAQARLEVAGRIHRPAQRSPWRVGPSPTESDSRPTGPGGVDTDRESDRPPPYRGGPTHRSEARRRDPRSTPESDRRRRPRRRRSPAEAPGGTSG
jgi:RecA-family ATPase